MLVLVAALAVLSPALGAKYCCYPPVWESLNFIREAGVANGAVFSLSGTEQTSVDTNKMMVNSMASLTSSGVTNSVRTIQDWNKEKQYQITGGKCVTSTLPGPYANRCVPDDARLDEYGIKFGIDTHELSFSVYTVIRGNVTEQLNVAMPDCIPIAVNSYGKLGTGQGLSDKIYSNFTLGIKDPSVFNIPSICTQ